MIVGAIGITPSLERAQQAWLRVTMRSWLARWDVELGYSNLESDAGIVFGEVLQAARIPYRVILPAHLGGNVAVQDESFKRALSDAVAVHQIEIRAGEDAWLASRMQVIEYCDVVFAVLSGNAATDGLIQNAQLKACLQQRAVISLNVAMQSAQVICKHDQW